MKRWWVAAGLIAWIACSDDSKPEDYFILSSFAPAEGSRILSDDTLAAGLVWKITDSNFTPTKYYVRLMFQDNTGDFTVPDTLILSHFYPVKSDSGSAIYQASAADAYADGRLGTLIRCRYELIRVIGGVPEIIDHTKTLRYSR